MNGLWAEQQSPIFSLAPMEDVTDTVFRVLVREWSRRWGAPGPDVLFTEFARADSAIRTAQARLQTGETTVPRRLRPEGRLQYTEAERPLVAQIWGTRPAEFEEAAAALEALGFDGIDLNMGCPAWKVRKAGACSALIGNPKLAGELIAACRRGSSLPLSVKTRIGIAFPETETWTRFLLDQGVDAITIHGRVAEQMSDGWADWREVRRVVELRDRLAMPTRIMGNGDVCSLDHARRLVEQTGVDGVMIGRGIFYDPLLFARDSATPPPPWEEIPLAERVTYLAEQIRAFHAVWHGRRSFEILKKFFRNYFAVDDTEQKLLRQLYTKGSAAGAIAFLREHTGLTGDFTDDPAEDELPEDLFGLHEDAGNVEVAPAAGGW